MRANSAQLLAAHEYAAVQTLLGLIERSIASQAGRCITMVSDARWLVRLAAIDGTSRAASCRRRWQEQRNARTSQGITARKGPSKQDIRSSIYGLYYARV